MSLRKDYEEDYPYFSDFSLEEDMEDLEKRKHIRKKLEDRLEQKRLREELDELDGEFDWDDLDK